jgi:hypothetical protein
MKKYKILLIFSLLFVFAIFNVSHASSGACSYHGGVDCSAGANLYGKVVCNDGWTNSSVYFSDVDECKSGESDCPIYIRDQDSYNQQKKDIEKKINQINARNQTDCENFYQSAERINEEGYQGCISSLQSILRISGGVGSVPFSDCEQEKNRTTQLNQSQKESCLHGSDDIIFKYKMLSACLVLDTTDYCSARIPNSHTENDKCICNSGYQVNSFGTGCVVKNICPSNSFLDNDNKCHCLAGYKPSQDSSACIKYEEPKTITPTISEPTQNASASAPEAINNVEECPVGYGYYSKIKKCTRIPENAHVVDTPTDFWACNDGYEEKNGSCVLIEEKEHRGLLGQLDFSTIQAAPEIKDEIDQGENAVVNRQTEEPKKDGNVKESTGIQAESSPKENLSNNNETPRPSVPKRIYNWFSGIFGKISSWFK